MTNYQTTKTQMAKTEAKRLRTHLLSHGYSLTHSDSLEAIAHSKGYKDWNTYSALLNTDTAPLPDTAFPFHVGDRVHGTYRGAAFQGILLGLEQTINKAVWRVILHFDTPVSPPSMTRIGLSRQRINCAVNKEGISVNLKGVPDGQIGFLKKAA